MTNRRWWIGPIAGSVKKASVSDWEPILFIASDDENAGKAIGTHNGDIAGMEDENAHLRAVVDALQDEVAKLRAVVVALGPNDIYDPGATAHNYSMSALYARLAGDTSQSEYLTSISDAVLALIEEDK